MCDRSAYNKAYRAKHREKLKAHSKAYYQANKDAHRARNRESRYGITSEQFDNMLHAQEGLCAICKADNPGTTKKDWYVDHCHTTGAVRGLLCHGCNTGLGGFKDNKSSLSEAIAYLERNK